MGVAFSLFVSFSHDARLFCVVCVLVGVFFGLSWEAARDRDPTSRLHTIGFLPSSFIVSYVHRSIMLFILCWERRRLFVYSDDGERTTAYLRGYDGRASRSVPNLRVGKRGRLVCEGKSASSRSQSRSPFLILAAVLPVSNVRVLEAEYTMSAAVFPTKSGWHRNPFFSLF